MRTTLFLLVIFIAFPFQTVGQNCQDAVHPTEFRMSIVGCCIREIKENNVVVYSLDGDVNEIEALAINYKGTYYALTNIESAIKAMEAIGKIPKGEYNGHDYLYYSNLHSQASSKMFFGITLTAIGAGMLVGGVSIMAKNANEASLSDDNLGIKGTGILLFLGGGASLVEIPPKLST